MTADAIEVDGAELAFSRTGGAGPAVVFVHGLGGTRESWAEQLAGAARAGFDAIALEMRGAGPGPPPPGPYSVEQWAADVVAVIDALGIERAGLVGHSVGCMTVEHAALELGGRCTALAMLGGTLAWPAAAGDAFAERARLARDGRLAEVAEAVAAAGLSERARERRPDLTERLIEIVTSNPPEGYAEAALAAGRGSMREPEAVECPALAFAGSEDPVTPVSAAEEVADAMPRGRSAAVRGGAHWCQLEAPEAVNEVLLPFLQGAATG